MFKFSTLLGLVALVPAFTLAVGEWGQCGGINYTGSTTCDAGLVCNVINDYYHQCLPTPDAGNPYIGYDVSHVLWCQIYLSPYYADEVAAAVSAISNPALAAKAASVANIPTFIWFDVVAKVPTLGTYLADALSIQQSTGRNQLVQIVVYDLPDRDCAALASNGEFSIANNGLANYKNYVDQIVAQIARTCCPLVTSAITDLACLSEYPQIRVVAVVEPDSLANMVTNLNVPKCAGAQAAYTEGVTYALQKLNTVGVYSYVDAGHAGWLGWPANLGPAAQLFANLYTNAGSPSFFRGLATNVANYNLLNAPSPDPVTSPNANYDEIHYINVSDCFVLIWTSLTICIIALAPELSSRGFPAHFIVDQGRSAVQGIRGAWGDWCNVDNAGFGTRPTTSTGSSLIDAIVWVKPGGESDGTSDTSAVRYDGHCGLASAKKPAPEAMASVYSHSSFQAYFEMLVANAVPAL
uniref:Glucanase n=1 Tax=Pleurotus sajor-caju TaxID=50053 RepID=Q96TP4_PLESA|nr:cellobiohydrolase II [Lentinus sajor-caju]AAL15038.1 cellobiohydrolase II [Lentinus sajor-caju]